MSTSCNKNVHQLVVPDLKGFSVAAWNNLILLSIYLERGHVLNNFKLLHENIICV